jgi:hypothetical protein
MEWQAGNVAVFATGEYLLHGRTPAPSSVAAVSASASDARHSARSRAFYPS